MIASTTTAGKETQVGVARNMPTASADVAEFALDIADAVPGPAFGIYANKILR
jgi:hypothetical protein